MKKVKIFTYIDRPFTPFLPLWIDYYTKNVNADLCILHRNIKLGKIKSINKNNIEIINIDHFFNDLNINEWVPPNDIFIIYQKQFLQTHDVVIYCDADEFIVHEDLDSIIRSDYTSCLVTTGIEIVENYPIDLKYDFTKNIYQQRKYMVRSNWYNKPIIINNFIDWQPGKHNHGQFNNYVPGLYLIHLGRVCLETYIKLWEDTKKMYSSSTYIKNNLKEYYIENFNNPQHPTQPMEEIPNDIKKLLNKII